MTQRMVCPSPRGRPNVARGCPGAAHAAPRALRGLVPSGPTLGRNVERKPVGKRAAIDVWAPVAGGCRRFRRLHTLALAAPPMLAGVRDTARWLRTTRVGRTAGACQTVSRSEDDSRSVRFVAFEGWTSLHDRVKAAATFDDVRGVILDARDETIRELADLQDQIEADGSIDRQSTVGLKRVDVHAPHLRYLPN